MFPDIQTCLYASTWSAKQEKSVSMSFSYYIVLKLLNEIEVISMLGGFLLNRKSIKPTKLYISFQPNMRSIAFSIPCQDGQLNWKKLDKTEPGQERVNALEKLFYL